MYAKQNHEYGQNDSSLVFRLKTLKIYFMKNVTCQCVIRRPHHSYGGGAAAAASLSNNNIFNVTYSIRNTSLVFSV